MPENEAEIPSGSSYCHRAGNLSFGDSNSAWIGGSTVRHIAILLALLAVLVPSTVQAWGPITHLEIAELQGGTSNDYRAGAILPDFSLAYHAAYDSSYPNLQSVTHSQAFVDALKEVARADFVAGWESHLYADTIESPYSLAKRASGAPTVADYVVDQAYATSQKDNCPEMGSGYIATQYANWIDYALDAVGCQTDYPLRTSVMYSYRMYISGGYQPKKAYYQQVLSEWYGDYEEYVYMAAGVPLLPDPPVPPPPTPPSILDTYYQYSYSGKLSATEVAPAELFSLAVIADVKCIKDLPMGVRKVEAWLDIETQDVVLVSNYMTTVSDFPDWAGDTASINETISMALPEDAVQGTHIISVRLQRILVDSWDVTGMIPSGYTSIPIGSVMCTVSDPVPPVPPPAPPRVNTRSSRQWYNYEAPANREAEEQLKSNKWAEISVAMRATNDIAEKLRLFAEWEIFRDAHSTPSERIG